jgi:GNAT superfamily N-acetyltransferase
MRVRRVGMGDRAAWERLFRDYNAFYGASVADAVIDLTWQRLLTGGEGDPVGLVVVDDAELPIGIAHMVFHRSTWSATGHCYLEDLFVDPAERGKGAGRALIEAVYREADARGCTRTYWVTAETNATARALYDRVASRVPFVQYRR